jgi:hypothetical protein
MTKGPLAATGKTALSAAERRAKAWELRLAGATLEQIGKQLGVTRQAVHYLLKRTLADLEKVNLDAAADLRAIEDARLEGRLLEISVLIQAHKSDPDMVAKLDARRQAISDAKRKLWGLDAPTKADVTSGGQRITLTWPEESDA